MSKVLIFGGSGFIGTHLASYLLEHNFAEDVHSCDLKPPRHISSRITHIECDVRKPIEIDIDGAEVIYNLAAVHTTPGHADWEYFTTNIKGAENICDFAARKGIKTIVFTSSISPYGPDEDLKTEDSLPQPLSAYGSSKLAAEYIHRLWLEKEASRRLIIVRPGVVFGQGEGGNFTRLYQSMKHRYFFYPGRKDTKKACIYVKDLVRAMHEMSESSERFQLYNMCYPEPPSIEKIAKVISEVTGVRNNSPVLSAGLLRLVAGFLAFMPNGIHPERVKKLMISTNISGEKLSRSPYAVKYSLKEAAEDWYKDCDRKGLF